MSMDMGASLERVCYVHCTFCSTILAVSVPWSSMYDMVTVRCGHCANLLSVNMTAASSHPPPPLSLGSSSSSSNNSSNSIGSSSTYTISSPSDQLYQPRTPPIRPPEKRQRVPSAYNKFIKEEIQRIKASNPEISHREAFSTAAKNWAHFPNIQFGLKYEEAKLDQSLPVAQETLPSSHGFY